MEICYLRDVVTIYGCIVSTYVNSNDEYSAHIRNTPFHSYYIPPLTISGFMERILKYFNCSAECYLLSLIYIDRLIRLDSFVINGYSVYRVVLTSLMLAAKYFDDVYFTNAFYADVGGISVEELNMLEVDFLCRIRFNLYVTPQDYQHYYHNLCDHCMSHCRNCRSIRLPTLTNCTPKEETPLLRFIYPQNNISPYASMISYSSNYYPSMTDYHTPPPTMNDSYYNSQSTYKPTSSLTNSYSNYYSSNQAYFSNQMYNYQSQSTFNPTISYSNAMNYASQLGLSSNRGVIEKNDICENIKEKSFCSSNEGDLLFNF